MVTTAVRRSRLRAALFAVVAGLGLGAIAAPASAINNLSDTGTQTFADVAACSATSDNLLAAIVVDESLSLKKTDPENNRVGAVLTALDSLERLGSSTDLSVEVNLSTFGSGFTTLVDWGQAGGEHLSAMRDSVTNELPNRNRSNLTDYRQALSQAQASLDARAQALDGSSCKIVLWLTDGKLDVDGKGDKPATDAARVELCQPGGIVDGVRADGVTVIALALMTSEGEGSVTDLDRQRLQAIAEGTGGGETCGTVPVNDSVSNGAFLNADDASALSRLFGQMGALLEGGTPGNSFTCPDATCTDGRLLIPVDRGVGGFRLVMEVDEGAEAPQLFGPDGEASVLGTAPIEIAGADVSTFTSKGLVTVDVRNLGDQVGAWTVLTDPTTTTIVDLYYFWDITLAVEAPDNVVIGQPSTIRVVPRSANGEAVDLSALGTADLVATVDSVPLAFERGEDAWTADVTVPADAATSAIVVAGRANATTAPSGIALGPVAFSQEFATQLPPVFPSVEPASLAFGRLSGETTAQAMLTLYGPERGEGQACFAPGTVTGPEGAGDITVTTASECFTVAAGESIQIPVTLNATHEADGLVQGKLPVTLLGVDADASVQLDIPVQGSMVRPVDVATRTWLVVALVAAALVIAWLVAAVGRALSQRYSLSPYARVAAVPVRVTPSGLERTDGETHLLDSAEFRALSNQATKGTRFAADEAQFFIHSPAFPLMEREALVRSSRGQVPITDVVRSSKDPRHRYTNFPGSTGFAVFTDRPEEGVEGLTGTLVVVLDGGSAGVTSVLSDRLQTLARAPWGDEIDGATKAWEEIETATLAKEVRRSRREPRVPSVESTPEPDLPPGWSNSHTSVSGDLSQSRSGDSPPGWGDDPPGWGDGTPGPRPSNSRDELPPW